MPLLQIEDDHDGSNGDYCNATDNAPRNDTRL
jgi:hypothetical protein